MYVHYIQTPLSHVVCIHWYIQYRKNINTHIHTHNVSLYINSDISLLYNPSSIVSPIRQTAISQSNLDRPIDEYNPNPTAWV